MAGDPMKETSIVVVKKNRNQIYGIRILAGICFLSLLIVIFSFGYDMGVILLICFPICCILITLLLYYETWKVTCGRDCIQKVCFFHTICSYSYNQITDAFLSQSYTEHSVLKVQFLSGKVLRFRLEDENADQALAKIRSHTSIRLTEP